jgi:N,N'-diacetyllegionaminate synthase
LAVSQSVSSINLHNPHLRSSRSRLNDPAQNLVSAVKPIVLGGRSIGPTGQCFIIAEAGVNHNGSLDAALRLVDIAHASGADAVKFQTFSADALAAPDTPKAEYQRQGQSDSESQLQMLRRLELSHGEQAIVFNRCRELGILFLSSPFDEESATFLNNLGVPAFKIGSGELTNLPLLEHVARMGKPIILSTGMADLNEVEAAVVAIAREGNPPLVLLQCVSNYPANPLDVNLRAMATMRDAFQVLVGYSDHTIGAEVSLAAVALGAAVIEKHFTSDRELAGPDHRASMEPDDLAALVLAIRNIEAALGNGIKIPAASEKDTAAVARKSLVAAVDLPAGTVLTETVIAIKRPGTGLAPSLRSTLVGRIARVPIPRGTVLSVDMLG